MPTPPTRRWFQFRLRTLLVGVVLIAVPLGYVAHEAKIVRDRVAYLRNPNGDRVFVYFLIYSEHAAAESKIPWIRRQLGDGPIKTIGLPLNSTMQERDEAAALFLEADIMAYGPPYTYTPGGPFPARLFLFPDSAGSAQGCRQSDDNTFHATSDLPPAALH